MEQRQELQIHFLAHICFVNMKLYDGGICLILGIILVLGGSSLVILGKYKETKEIAPISLVIPLPYKETPPESLPSSQQKVVGPALFITWEQIKECNEKAL